MRINPYFEIDGNRYEIQRTRWLVAEYKRLNEENPLGDQDRANAIKATNLVSDAKKFAEKEKEWWDKLCEEPTEENQRTYLLFKGMSDKAIADYNEFVTNSKALKIATDHSYAILEKVAIKALAEQFYGMNENLASQTWQRFVESNENPDKVAEWLNAMAECFFVEENDEENNDFLSQKRKADEERELNRKNAIRTRR